MNQRAAKLGGQIAGIDGLRALSVLFVMALHASYGRLNGGFLGVDIFFVISGFLITHLLVEEQRLSGRVSLSHFYLRRVFRILPPLIVTIILALILWRGDAVDRWPVARAALFFYANFLPAERLGDLGHTWSLAIEEQFYLVWPLLFIIFAARWPRALMGVALAVILGSFLTRYYMVGAGADLNALYSFTPARLDPIMLGSLIALSGVAQRSSPPLLVRAAAWGSFALAIGFFLLATRDRMQGVPVNFLLFALVAGTLVASVPQLAPRDPLAMLLGNPLARYIGKRSYGLYLYHYPIFGAMEGVRIEGNLTNYIWVTAVKCLLAFGAAELSWRLIEQPMLRLKSRVAARPVARTVVSSAA